jgi:hypothetical protein
MQETMARGSVGIMKRLAQKQYDPYCLFYGHGLILAPPLVKDLLQARPVRDVLCKEERIVIPSHGVSTDYQRVVQIDVLRDLPLYCGGKGRAFLLEGVGEEEHTDLFLIHMIPGPKPGEGSIVQLGLKDLETFCPEGFK